MRCDWRKRLVISVMLLSAASIAQTADWGNVSGRMVVDGDVPPPNPIVGPPGLNLVDESVIVGQGGVLRNVLVYLRTKDVEVAPRYAASANDEIVLDIKNGRLEPRMLVVRTTQTLKLTNSDAFNVNIKLTTISNPNWNPLLLAGTSAKMRLAVQESLPGKVDSNIQPWLRGWILVRDNPYAAVSASDGTFTIRDLPVGAELEFQLWQARRVLARRRISRRPF